MLQRSNSAALGALVALVALLGWPADGFRARTGLDPSWQLAGTFAHTEGLDYGADIVFNFGPLGFLVAPIVGGGRWFAIGVLGLAALLVVVALAVFGALRLHGAGRGHALGVTAVVMLLAPTETSLAELVVLAAGFVVVLGRWHGAVWGPHAWAAAGVLAAVLTLVKISTGPVLLAVVVASAAIDTARVRALAASSAAFLVALVTGWIVLGQRISDLGRWLRGAFEIGAGHTDAMSIGTPGGAWQYGALLVVLAGAPTMFVATRRVAHSASGIDTYACVAMAVLLAWFFVKQGFVRRDGHAAVFFFEAAVALAVLVPWGRMPRLGRAAAGGLVVVSSIAFLAIQDTALVRLVNPVRPVVDVALSGELLVSAGARTAAHLDANRDARATYAVPQQILDTIGDAPVHVDPWEITLAWAYGLEWRPVPTLQNYLGYTDHLDDRNADALTAPDGPRYVLRTPHGPIDDRFPLTDGPAYHVALLCNFTSVHVDGGWQLFERSAPRCGGLVRHSSVELDVGRTVALPDVAANTAVLISVDYHPTLPERLAALALKPPSSPQLLVDGRAYRMIPATATRPGLIVVPGDWPSAPADPREIGVDRPATITIFTMEVGVSGG